MIPQLNEFVLKVGRGPNLNKVTNALELYWTLQARANQTIKEQVECYSMLINACKEWIKRKDGKSDYKKNFLGQTTGLTNLRFTGRRTEISKIGEAATVELMRFLHANDMLQSDQRGQLSFDIRKFKQKGTQALFRQQTKSLSHGYEQERTGWLSSGKTQAISGTKIHGIHQDGGLGTKDKLSRTQKKALDSVVSGTGGTARDWSVLSEIEKIGDMRVAFLRKSARYRYMTYTQGGLLVDAQNERIDHGKKMVLWTMDRYGNMFVFDDDDVWKQTKIGQVNHSSMNAGKEVICAGMIVVKDGLVADITNTSGHYKPTAEHMAAALAILLEDDLDLSSATIRTAQFPGSGPGRAWWVTWSLGEFVRSQGKLGEISREDGPQP